MLTRLHGFVYHRIIQGQAFEEISTCKRSPHKLEKVILVLHDYALMLASVLEVVFDLAVIMY